MSKGEDFPIGMNADGQLNVVEEGKTDLVMEMLQRPGGATYDELCVATGWDTISVHAHCKARNMLSKLQQIHNQRPKTLLVVNPARSRRRRSKG